MADTLIPPRGQAGRCRLPDRRKHETFEFEHHGLRFTASIGFYRLGVAGELFLNARRSGGDLESVAKDAAILTSLCLQHGVALETIAQAVTRDHAGKAASLIGAAVDAALKIPRGVAP